MKGGRKAPLPYGVSMKNCVVYTKGNSKTVKGIECDLAVVSFKEIKEYLAKGYFMSPEEVYADKNDSGKLSNEEIRMAAKEAGLDNWKKGHIKTLKEALGYES